MSHIGIKLANHKFFPILDENEVIEKDLELTTVRDNQESVQINLFKKTDDSDPEYIGSLMIEDIAPQLKGDATITLKLKMDEDKNLSAEAVDINSGAKQSLELSLKNIDSDNLNNLDFDFADNNADSDFEEVSFDEDTGVIAEEEVKKVDLEEIPDFGSTTVNSEIYINEKRNKSAFPLWLTVFLILLGIGLLALAILLLINVSNTGKKLSSKNPSPVEMPIQENNKTEDMGSMTKETPKPAETPKPEEEVKKTEGQMETEKAMELEKTAVAKTDTENKGQSEEKKVKPKKEEPPVQKVNKTPAAKKNKQVKQNITKTGAVRYKIKWGDTLWDLSETYYKNPWLYRKIARHNKIRNPNLIVSGTYIEIPPR